MEEDTDYLVDDYKDDIKFGTKLLLFSLALWCIVLGIGLWLIQTGHNARLLMIIGRLFGWGILFGLYYLGKGIFGYIKNKRSA